MNPIPKVSVIMPCYNAEKYLSEAIESILHQTYHSLEIILVNDGSTDRTGEIIREYALKDSRIIPLQQEKNLGLILTLNNTVALATGEFIARMDADDISSSRRIEVLIKVLQDNSDISIVSSANYYVNSRSKRTHYYEPKGIHNAALKFASFFCTPVIHPGILARAEVLKKNPYNPDYIHSEDYELFSTLIQSGYKFMNVNLPLHFIRIHDTRVSRIFEKIQIETHTRISKRNIKNYFQLEIPNVIHQMMINRFDFAADKKSVLLAFEKLELLEKEFLLREICSEEEIKEIRHFITEQKIDIVIQFVKRNDRKTSSFFFALKYFPLFMRERAIRYVLNKIKFKMKN